MILWGLLKGESCVVNSPPPPHTSVDSGGTYAYSLSQDTPYLGKSPRDCITPLLPRTGTQGWYSQTEFLT